jgi:hypothetical protein
MNNKVEPVPLAELLKPWFESLSEEKQEEIIEAIIQGKQEAINEFEIYNKNKNETE